jgi:hypothetical protein
MGISLVGSTAGEYTFALTKADKKQRSVVCNVGLLPEFDTESRQVVAQLDKDRMGRGPAVTRCRLIQFYPTPEQANCLQTWFRDARKTYNQVMSSIIEQGLHKDIPASLAQVESILSKQFVGANGVSRRKNDFHMLRTPKVVRQQAMKSAVSVLKAFNVHASTNKRRNKSSTRKRSPSRGRYALGLGSSVVKGGVGTAFHSS